jgi:hypothetical protein
MMAALPALSCFVALSCFLAGAANRLRLPFWTLHCMCCGVGAERPVKKCLGNTGSGRYLCSHSGRYLIHGA